jgi:hypothetical protein
MSTPPAHHPVKHSLRDHLHQQILPALEALVAALPPDLTEAAQAERQIRAGVLAAARSLLAAWGQSADATAERPACPSCGVPMRHKGYKAATTLTTLGAVAFTRTRFRCADCAIEFYPHDAQLRFLGHGVSWPLAEVVGRQAALLPFEQARDNVEADYGVHLAKQTVADVAEAAGAEVLRHEDAQRDRVAGRQEPLPDSPLQPEQACVFADGTTVHTEGDWHEIRVATATAEDAAGRPLARQSRARFLPVADFAWMLVLLARAVGYANARRRAFIADGAHWLWKLAEDYFPYAIQILDWYHLAEHIHQAAAAVFGEGTAAATEWAAARKTELWEGVWRPRWLRSAWKRRGCGRRANGERCTNCGRTWRTTARGWTTRGIGTWAYRAAAARWRRSARRWWGRDANWPGCAIGPMPAPKGCCGCGRRCKRTAMPNCGSAGCG